MFTDKFVKVPIEIVYPANESLGTKERILCDDIMMLNPFDIVAYRNHYNEEGEADFTTVEIRSNDNIIAKLTVKEFEKLLNDHQK